MAISTSPSSISVSQTYGKTADTTTVTLNGDYLMQSVIYQISSGAGWFTVSPKSGSFYSPGTVYVSFPNSETLMPGTYTSSFKVQAPATSPYEVTVPVSLTIIPGAGQPVIGISSTTGFSHDIKVGHVPANDTFTVSNTNYGNSPAMAFTASPDQSWLSCSPSSGSATNALSTINIQYNTASLNAGIYTAHITVVGANASNSPLTFPVTVHISDYSPPQIAVSPTTGFSKTMIYGGTLSADVFEIWNANYGDSQAMPFTVSGNVPWLTLSPPSGSATATHIPITVTYHVSGLTAGTHSGVVTVNGNGAGNTPLNIPVTVKVDPAGGTPQIGLSVTRGLARTVNSGTDLFTDTFELWNATYGLSPAMNYSVSANVNWIVLSPSSGTATDNKNVITAQYNIEGFAPGTYRAALTVTGTGASNSPCTVPVTLTIIDSGESAQLTVSPSTGFTRKTTAGDILPDDTLQMWNKAFQINQPGINWTMQSNASWLAPSPTSGTLFGNKVPLTLHYNTTGLPSGTHKAHIVITPDSDKIAPRIVPVTLTVAGTNNAKPEIALSTPGGFSRVAAVGTNPQDDTVQLWNKTYGSSPAMPWTASSNQNWLTVSPASGTANDSRIPLTLKYNTAGLPAGIYSAIVTLVAPNAFNSPQRMQIMVKISDEIPKPVIGISPVAGFSRSTDTGNSLPPDTAEVWNTTYGDSPSMPWTAVPSADWLKVTPSSGTATDVHTQLTVNYDTTGLAVGTYTGTIAIVAPNANPVSQTIPVSLTITDTPKTAIAVSPAIGFTRTGNTGSTISSDKFVLWNSNYTSAPQEMPYVISSSAGWLSFSPASGSVTNGSAEITVNYNTTGLAAGSYDAVISVISTGASNTPVTIPVALTLNYVQPPAISVTPQNLLLTALLDQLPSDGWCPSQSFSISNSGQGTLQYTLTSNVFWMRPSPANGSTTNTTQQINVNYNSLRYMNVGTYGGTITITAPGAVNSPLSIPVTLVVAESSDGVWYTSQFPNNITTGWSAQQPAQWTLSNGSYAGVSPIYGKTLQSTYTGGNWLSETLSVTMRRVYTNNYTQYQGIFFRASDDFVFDWYGNTNRGQAYVLLLGGNQWRLFFVNNGNVSNVTGWNSSTAISTSSNASNTVKITANDYNMSVSINNWTVWNGSDYAYRRPGKMGLIGINPTTGYTPAFYFDQVTVSSPQ